MKQEMYFLYRKMKALGTSLIFYICRIFPVHKYRISICTFEGKGGFGCNPKYVVQALHQKHPECQFIWFVNDMHKQFPPYIKKVKNTIWNRAFWLSTSQIWIDNYRKPYGTCKRKAQFYLNTNHYTVGFKSTGLWRGSAFSKMAYLVSKNDSNMIDAVIIDSKWCEDCFQKALLYDGRYIKSGSPRCDILFGKREQARRSFRRKYDLPDDVKILMFAPTFREGAKNGKRSVYSEVWTIDFARLLKNMKTKFGGVWYICIRVHPQLAPSFETYKNEEVQKFLIDESQADDMYEILAAIDAYITDYSSAAFEAGFAKIPVFLYADDIVQYTKDRGSLMWNMTGDTLDHITNNKNITPHINTKLPFSVATNNEDLEKHILDFDMQQYYHDIDVFCKEIDLVFDGKASNRIVKVLEKHM